MQKNKAGKGAGEKERQSGVGDLDLLLREWSERKAPLRRLH